MQISSVLSKSFWGVLKSYLKYYILFLFIGDSFSQFRFAEEKEWIIENACPKQVMKHVMFVLVSNLSRTSLVAEDCELKDGMFGVQIFPELKLSA